MALQRYGVDGIGAIYDRLSATTRFLHAAVSGRSDFEALHEPESNILCFRYLGDRSRGDERPDRPKRLDRLNLRLREEFNRSGEGWITTTMLSGKRVLRATVMNHRTTERDVAGVLDGLAAIGGRLGA